MVQIFRPSSNNLSRFSIAFFCVLIFLTALSAYAYMQSAYFNGVGFIQEQPVPFSHKHHVKGLGLDCRFCHFAVESSATAGMPSTETCLSCHSQLYQKSKILSPLHESDRLNKPILWNRVHDLPDHVYFDHSVHINRNIACSTCHGQVEEMPLTSKEKPMTMKWCLECHLHPGTRASDQGRMNNCYECHR